MYSNQSRRRKTLNLNLLKSALKVDNLPHPACVEGLGKYGHLPPIMKIIQVRWTRHVGHCWRNKDELLNDILQWTPSHGRTKAGQLTRTYIQQLCANTGCSLENLLGAMDDRDGWWERVKEICAGGGIWW